MTLADFCSANGADEQSGERVSARGSACLRNSFRAPDLRPSFTTRASRRAIRPRRCWSEEISNPEPAPSMGVPVEPTLQGVLRAAEQRSLHDLTTPPLPARPDVPAASTAFRCNTQSIDWRCTALDASRYTNLESKVAGNVGRAKTLANRSLPFNQRSIVPIVRVQRSLPCSFDQRAVPCAVIFIPMRATALCAHHARCPDQLLGRLQESMRGQPPATSPAELLGYLPREFPGLRQQIAPTGPLPISQPL